MILHPYQVAAAEFLAARKSALLADEMRVGKTGAAIRACDLVGARRVLWLTTASAKTDHARAWRELQQVEREVSVDVPCDGVTITNYERVKRLMGHIFSHEWDAIVCDESHRLKNRNANRTKHLIGDDLVVKRTKHFWFLSGTPAPNDPSELWPMLRATMPDVIPSKTGKPMNYWQFVNRYCRTKDNGFGIKIVGAKNMNDLRQRLAPYVLRRKLAEVMPEIPAQSFELVYFDAGDALRELEEDYQIEFMAKYLDGFYGEHSADEQLAMLDQIEKDVKARIRRLTGMAKVKHVVEWVKDRLDGNDDKIVLFAHHRDVIERLEGELVHYMPHVIEGSTPSTHRELAQREFREYPTCRVMIGQIQAAGEAIDLSAADEVMFVEASWVPKDNQQAAARVVNIGKNKPTFAWFATLADSIDEKIQRTVARKTADLAALFD